MKKLIFLLLIIVGCSEKKPTTWRITNKYPTEDRFICKFFRGDEPFYDSCSKYNVGDSLVITIKPAQVRGGFTQDTTRYIGKAADSFWKAKHKIK